MGEPAFARRMAARLAATCDPVAVLLCGSWAKGSASTLSDVDLVVVLDSAPTPAQRAALHDAVRIVPMHVDLLVWTSADVAAARSDPHGFAGSVLRSSIVLHGALSDIPRPA